VCIFVYFFKVNYRYFVGYETILTLLSPVMMSLCEEYEASNGNGCITTDVDGDVENNPTSLDNEGDIETLTPELNEHDAAFQKNAEVCLSSVQFLVCVTSFPWCNFSCRQFLSLVSAQWQFQIILLVHDALWVTD